MEKITKDNWSFFAQQPFLIGTRDEDGERRFAPISWISFTAGKPFCLVISIENAEKRTARNILRTGQLTATVLTRNLLRFAECQNHATANPFLLERVRPAFEDAKTVDAPLIAGAKWSYECKLLKTVEIGEAQTFFAEVTAVNVADDVQELDFIDLREINPVVYTNGHYFSIGEHLGAIGDFSK